jgi:hypothetical protein
MVKQARISGFNNVHDYLIHMKTNESAGKIAKRKLSFGWGKWLMEDTEQNEEPHIEEENQEENKKGVRRMRTRRPLSSDQSLTTKKETETKVGALEYVETPAKTSNGNAKITRRTRKNMVRRGLALSGS